MQENNKSTQWTDEELSNILEELRTTKPKLYQFITDYICKNIDINEIEHFNSLSDDEKRKYIDNYIIQREEGVDHEKK